MRTADTYRAWRRNECRSKCRAYGLKLVDKWHELTAKNMKGYVMQSCGGKYTPHQGHREKARRLAHMEKFA